MRKALVFVFLATFLLGACARLPVQQLGTPVEGNPEQLPTAGTETPLSPTSSEQDQPSPVELTDGAVLVFHRSGGIAGLNEVWTVYSDGRVSLSERDKPQASPQEWQVEPEKVMALLEKIDSLGFFTLQGNGKPVNPCCDRFSYSLAVAYQGNSRELSGVEGASGMPDGYWKAVSEVQAFLQAASQQPPLY